MLDCYLHCQGVPQFQWSSSGSRSGSVERCRVATVTLLVFGRVVGLVDRLSANAANVYNNYI